MGSPLTDILTKYDIKIVTEYEEVQRLPSGSINLDMALGGGWPKGRISELWGGEHLGKSLIAMMTIGRTIAMGGSAVLLDMENGFDPTWAKNFIDLDCERFVPLKQKANTYAERILDMIHELAENGVDLIVLDSKDALVFEAEVEGQTGNANMGIRSKRFTYFATRLSQIIGDSKTTFLFVSQVRANIGDQWHPETTSGGHALNHFCSIRMQMRSPTPIKVKVDGKETKVGSTFNGFVNKNKTAEAFKTAGVRVREFETAEGSLWKVDTAYEVLEYATELGLLALEDGRPYNGAGNAYFGKELLGNKPAANQRLNAEPVLLYQIEQAIRRKMGWS